MPGTLIVEKSWGREVVLVNDEGFYCLKELHIDPGRCCSCHMHPVKRETFCVIDGRATIEINGDVKDFRHGDSVTIEPGTWHRFGSVCGAMIAEVSTYHSDDDVVRDPERLSGEWPDEWNDAGIPSGPLEAVAGRIGAD